LISAKQLVRSVPLAEQAGFRLRGHQLLAAPVRAQMRADGVREALRLLMIDRDNAVQSCKTALTVLASVLVTAPPGCASRSVHSQVSARSRVSPTEPHVG
jgi:hypothetical protein